ncbi:MAG TPA: sigma 54-interacting transcriptional regulator [Thermoanaerobaculia bacterium]|jgi:DNA-binding NtrC family response regulator|nr:sigma 54-interacting transcriptional regulator [Thermoanaerobaculia bacterium]
MHLLKKADSQPATAFLGRSPAIEQLLAQAERAASGGDRPVLITGEMGSGKSHLASYVHQRSPRSRGPFVVVDCGALPELDNALFGHRSGSFTGAVRDLGGRFDQANGGVLVLDDFERLSQPQQDRLHRVIVDGTFYPLGSERPHAVDVRFVATTNKDVQAEVAAGRLKSDFVSRLDYFELAIPSLRDRREDIPALCEQLLRRNLADLLRKGMRENLELRFDEDCWPAIQARNFPDNVRGLDKLVVRLIAQVGGRSEIRPADVEAVCPSSWRSSDLPWFDQPQSLRRVRELAERRYILEVCRLTSFNLRRASRILEISPKSLYVKLRQYGIERP